MLLTLVSAGPALAGLMVEARCPCGYHKNLSLFGGKANFREVCLFPALCPGARELVLVNLLEPSAPPTGCEAGGAIPYDDPSLAPAPGGKVVASWRLPGRGERQAVLYDGGYVCPRCQARTLRFLQVGFWD